MRILCTVYTVYPPTSYTACNLLHVTLIIFFQHSLHLVFVYICSALLSFSLGVCVFLCFYIDSKIQISCMCTHTWPIKLIVSHIVALYLHSAYLIVKTGAGQSQFFCNNTFLWHNFQQPINSLDQQPSGPLKINSFCCSKTQSHWNISVVQSADWINETFIAPRWIGFVQK